MAKAGNRGGTSLACDAHLVQVEQILVNLNGTDLGKVGWSRSELDSDLIIGYGDGESLVDRRQGGTCCCDDVEIREHGRAVDRDIEDALAGCGPIDFRKL